MGRRDPAFLTSFLYFFSFFSHFLDAETICLEVIFMLMSSSWRETRWPMVVVLSSYAASRRLAWGRLERCALCGTLSTACGGAFLAKCDRSGSNAAVALVRQGLRSSRDAIEEFF